MASGLWLHCSTAESRGTGGCSPPGTLQHTGTRAVLVCMACWWLLPAFGISYRTVTLTSVSLTMSHSPWDSGGVGLGRGHDSLLSKGTRLTSSFFGSPKTPWPATSSSWRCALLPTQTLLCCMLDRWVQPPNARVFYHSQGDAQVLDWPFSMQGLAHTYRASLEKPHSPPVHWPLRMCFLNTWAQLRNLLSGSPMVVMVTQKSDRATQD